MFPISDSAKSGIFPIINISLIVLTILVFFQQITTTNQEAFIYQYALIPSLVDFSNYETLIPFVTAMFFHGGFLHIISNMWFLWIFGDNVESQAGIVLYPFIYFASGIIGNVLQYTISPNSDIPMLGASGAVAGVLGAYYVWFPYSKIKTIVPIFLFLTVINIPAPIMLGYWFVLQVISGTVTLPFLGDGGGIAFFAHIGGFLSGVVLANVIKNETTLGT